METIILGSTGIAATRSGFGALPIQRLSKEEAARLLVLAYEGGINFFDTANAYTDSEEKIGLALSSVRKNIFLATKTGSSTPDQFWKHLELSLTRMKTDYIDIYQFHNPASMPSDEMLSCMVKAKAQGMIPTSASRPTAWTPPLPRSNPARLRPCSSRSRPCPAKRTWTLCACARKRTWASSA